MAQRPLRYWRKRSTIDGTVDRAMMRPSIDPPHGREHQVDGDRSCPPAETRFAMSNVASRRRVAAPTGVADSRPGTCGSKFHQWCSSRTASANIVQGDPGAFHGPGSALWQVLHWKLQVGEGEDVVEDAPEGLLLPAGLGGTGSAQQQWDTGFAVSTAGSVKAQPLPGLVVRSVESRHASSAGPESRVRRCRQQSAGRPQALRVSTRRACAPAAGGPAWQPAAADVSKALVDQCRGDRQRPPGSPSCRVGRYADDPVGRSFSMLPFRAPMLSDPEVLFHGRSPSGGAISAAAPVRVPLWTSSSPAPHHRGEGICPRGRAIVGIGRAQGADLHERCRREHAGAVEFRPMSAPHQPCFVHLRLHTEYSISDGISSSIRLYRAAADGMPALAFRPPPILAWSVLPYARSKRRQADHRLRRGSPTTASATNPRGRC